MNTYDFNNDFVAIKCDPGKVIVRFSGTPTTKEVDEFLKAMANLYTRKEEFRILYDGLNSGSMDFALMKRQGEFMKQYAGETKKYMKRAAIVVRSPAQSVMMNLLFKMFPPACPHVKTFTTMKEALVHLASV